MKNKIIQVFCAFSTIAMAAAAPAANTIVTEKSGVPVAPIVERAVKLVLNWKPEPQFGGFYAAELSGEFKRNGLKVEIAPGGMGTPVVQMVAGGSADFGIASADEVVISRSRGSQVMALFAVFQTNPQGIMVHEERGFKSLADVFEKPGTLAIQKGLPYALYLTKKYAQVGRAAKELKTVPYLGGVQNFLTDPGFSQQCFVTSEPLAAVRLGAKVKTFLVAEAGYNPYTSVLITRDDVVKKNPQLVNDLVKAVRAGWRRYLDAPDDTNKFMSTLNPSMDLDTFALSAITQRNLIQTKETGQDKLGLMTETRWKELGIQLVDLGLIESAPAPKLLFQQIKP